MNVKRYGEKQQEYETWWPGTLATCGECGCQFELEAADNLTTYCYPVYGASVRLACPQCEHPVYSKNPRTYFMFNGKMEHYSPPYREGQ